MFTGRCVVKKFLLLQLCGLRRLCALVPAQFNAAQAVQLALSPATCSSRTWRRAGAIDSRRRPALLCQRLAALRLLGPSARLPLSRRLLTVTSLAIQGLLRAKSAAAITSQACAASLSTSESSPCARAPCRCARRRLTKRLIRSHRATGPASLSSCRPLLPVRLHRLDQLSTLVRPQLRAAACVRALQLSSLASCVSPH